MPTLFADILLPLPLRQLYTYAIPEHLANSIQTGMRVIVNLGSKKFYTGLVMRIHDQQLDLKTVKPIAILLDKEPSVTKKQLELWIFVANYYCCSLGEVYNAALPSSLKIQSEAYICANDTACQNTGLSEREMKLLDKISDGGSYKLSEFPSCDIRIIKNLIDNGLITYNEHLNDKYKQLYTNYVVLDEAYRTDQALNDLFLSLKRARSQASLLEQFISLSIQANPAGTDTHYSPVLRETMLKTIPGCSSTLRTMIKRGVFRIEKKKRFRTDVPETDTKPIRTLTPQQEEALCQIKADFQTKPVVLLHGVTASGKTEIYIKLIEEQIALGKQVLMLIPEIALTQELAHRLQRFFGNDICVYHSRYDIQTRADIYKKLLSDNPYRVILGVRSSVFLPFTKLGLIIVDEEHDTSYRQSEPAPRYNGRDAAIYLAHLHQTKTLLGTATPSIESYANCHFHKYGLVTLNERYSKIPLPTIQTIDLRECYKKRAYKGHFSFEMINDIRTALNAKSQVILFQNRRGYSPYVECGACAHVPHCPNCDVSLTYHKSTNSLSCHYCGYTQPLPPRCPDCGTTALLPRGFGTEQVEIETQALFPDARVARLDSDTTRTLGQFDRLMEDFKLGEIDILIGTQIISKGLDFENVGLVGVLNADNILNAPDFRAHERAFQMLVQVAGRSGRFGKQGKMLIQTSQPANPVLQQIIANRYDAFFATQMIERNQFCYPPYFRLISISVKDEDKTRCEEAATALASRMKEIFVSMALGPDTPLVERIQNKFIRRITIKIPINNTASAKQQILSDIECISSWSRFKNTIFVIDADPM